MPYFITDKSTECDAWAVIKDDGEVLACHADKQSAIDQMVAVSLAEDIQPGGERNTIATRAVDLTPPQYMRDAARQGLEYYEAGLGGDGLVARTISEARDMAAGRVTADKWVRIAAWIARHMVDLDASKNTDPADPEYPGAGLVAHLLWGSGNSKSEAARAMSYAQDIVNRLKVENDERAVNLNQKETRMETRHFNGTINGLEIRADGDGRTFSGYAAVFNADSEPMGGFTERIAPGAFRRSLTSHGWDVKLLANHDAGRVLGSTRAKTLRLTEDDRGLYVEATLPDNTDGRDIAESIRRGDIDSMSFGFSITPGGDSWSNDGAIRTLTDVKLYEVSIVAWPAYTSTAGTTSVRALTAYAQRTDIDSDALKGAIDALTEVKQLTTEQAQMLRQIIDQLEMESEQEQEIEDEIDMTEVAPAEDVIDEMPLDVLLNQIQLKLKGISNGN